VDVHNMWANRVDNDVNNASVCWMLLELESRGVGVSLLLLLILVIFASSGFPQPHTL
jgi:hypothetical protein